MVNEQDMRESLQTYIDLFNAHDAPGLAALFADDASIEDPVGGNNVVRGRAEIDIFYERAVTIVDRLELYAIRGSHGTSAAMAFDIHMRDEEGELRVGVIDVMDFNEAGQITNMKAYHGPADAKRSRSE